VVKVGFIVEVPAKKIVLESVEFQAYLRSQLRLNKLVISLIWTER
jgi:hypothetical protein